MKQGISTSVLSHYYVIFIHSVVHAISPIPI